MGQTIPSQSPEFEGRQGGDSETPRATCPSLRLSMSHPTVPVIVPEPDVVHPTTLRTA